MKEVSVIIPVHKKNPFLRDSIISAKSQNKSEVIVVLDSFDKELKIFLENLKPDKIICGNWSDPSKARQIGIENSDTNYIAFLDSDDIIIENRLDEQLNWMKKNNINWSYASFIVIKSNKKYYYQLAEEIINFKKLIQVNLIGNSTVIVKKKFLPKKLPKPPLEDFKLWIYLSNENVCYPFNKFSRYYNIHPDQISKNKFKMFYWRFLYLIEIVGLKKTIVNFPYYIFINLKKRFYGN